MNYFEKLFVASVMTKSAASISEWLLPYRSISNELGERGISTVFSKAKDFHSAFDPSINQLRVGSDSASPRLTTFFHEAGHALDRGAMTRLMRKAVDYGGGHIGIPFNDYTKTSLGSEFAANQMARKFLTPATRDQFNQIEAPFYRRYKILTPIDSFAADDSNDTKYIKGMFSRIPYYMNGSNPAMEDAAPLKSIRRNIQRQSPRFDNFFRQLHGEMKFPLSKQARSQPMLNLEKLFVASALTWDGDRQCWTKSAATDPIAKFRGQMSPAESEKWDFFMAKLGVGPKYVPLPAQKHTCPKCGKGNATKHEAHADTGMDCMELRCPDCGYESEEK